MKSKCLEDVKEMYNYNFTKCCFLIVLTLFTILIFVIIFVLTKVNGISQERKYLAMWEYGWHYHEERVDVKILSFDCGITVDFKQSN